jgi:transcriptional regulator with XRE-family HTH domain
MLEPIYRKLAKNARIARERAGMSQRDVAKKMKITQPNLAYFENGKQRLPLHLIERFAKAVGTTPKKLFKGIWM